MDLQQRVALITGGTKGIGAATAVALAKAGADVALAARRDGEHVSEIRRAIEDVGRRCEFILADVESPDDCIRCVQEASHRLGPIDILIHAAGGPAPGGILEIDASQWQRAFDVHVNAAFHLCRQALPSMRKQRRGAIVLVSSVAGLRGCPGNFAYQVVKGALPQFTRALARDFAVDNIRVNCVAPGIIRTAFHESMPAEQKQINLEHRIPLRCEGAAVQVADLILHLVANDYVTGETVTLDGGLSMRIA